MPIDRTSASEQIANELRAQIEAGELSAGEPLPSDSELAKRFDVSRPTATKARTILVALGLVSSRVGRASTVRDAGQRAVPAVPHPLRAPRAGRTYPAGHYATILSARTSPAPSEVAVALGVDVDASVIERRQVIYAADHTPLAASTTYFPVGLADQCPGLLETRRIRQGTTVYIEEQAGRVASSTVAAAASRPAGDDSSTLQLAAGSYALAISTTTYDADGVALAHEIELHPPDTPIALDVISV
jgi:GntR family transcriptional regulator